MRQGRWASPEDLRAALRQIAPDAVPAFDAERVVALREARERISSAPMRRFVGQWAVYVALWRHPERAARLHALEVRSAETDSLEEARSLVTEIGRILRDACIEANVIEANVEEP
ncbi:DUF6247 family protein [Streptomyces sp. NPDC001339]|uniref:DUF6247 family protein n=1 Tax=Streptomyces sp. NPDC001339 TaxID=3364563 RepID=UPI00369CA852